MNQEARGRGRKNRKASQSSAWKQRALGPQAGGQEVGKLRGSWSPELLGCAFGAGGGEEGDRAQSRAQAGSEPERLWQQDLPSSLMVGRLGLNSAAGSLPALAELTHIHTRGERWREKKRESKGERLN